jgi:putative ABC transport system permease protein
VEMEQVFAQMLRDAASSPARQARLWIRGTLDVLAHAGIEHMKRLKPGPLHDHRPGRRSAWSSSLLEDLRYGARGLIRAPGYSVAFVVTLGMGIGANTAIFSVINGVLIRALPYDDADDLVYLEQPALVSGFPYNATFSIAEVADYRRQSTTLEGFAQYSQMSFTLLGRGDPRRVSTAVVSGNFFSVLGAQAAIGRTMGIGDDDATALPVAVLTHSSWADAFDADSGAIGSTFQMNDRTITVIGVLEPIPVYPAESEVFVNVAASPHHLSAAMTHDRQHRMTHVFARLRPGVTLHDAQAELERIADGLHHAYPDAYPVASRFGIRAMRLHEALVGKARPTLYALMGTAVFVLIIACANVANLSLTRVVRREREIAVRAALGATASRIRLHLLTETTILAVIGAGLSLTIAWLSLGILIPLASRYTTLTEGIQIDGLVLTFAGITAMAVAFVITWGIPIPREPAHAMAAGGGRTSDSRARRGVQRVLVVAQLAVSFMLLIGAGLFLQTLLNLSRVDPGFDPQNVLTMNLPAARGMNMDEEKAFFEEVIRRIEAHVAVRGAAVAMVTPLRGSPMTHNIQVEGRPLQPGQSPPTADFRSVSVDYFAVVGMPLVRGRTFTSTDRADSPPVVIMNQSMAQFYFPNEDPVGKRIAWRWDDASEELQWKTIVGVVADSRDYGLDQGVIHAVFQPYAQEPWGNALLVRTIGAPASVARDVVTIIREINPQQAVENVATLEQIKADSIAPRRINATLIAAFAALAVVIATVGVSGVLAFSVSQRRHEFGIRLTLGADRFRVLRMVLGEGARLALLALVIGSVGALALSRMLMRFLYGVTPTDPVIYGSVALVLFTVSLGAAWIPARRATSADPLDALRHG